MRSPSPVGKTVATVLAAGALACAPAASIACEHATPQQIADALAASPTLNSGLKSCAMAAMAMNESGGGNTCAQNNCCIGVLQVNASSGGLNWNAAQRQAYLNSDLQTQINSWASVANSNASSTGYQTLLSAYNSGQTVSGYTVTPGLLAACEQFGPGVCNSNVAALKSTGSCGGAADGNGQTICSWGAATDRQASKQNCSLNSNSGVVQCGPGDFPPGPPVASNATPPSATSADLNLPANAG